MSALARNNVQVRGRGPRSMVFAHGFGCDQVMWRLVAPAFEESFRTVLFDHVGAGGSDLSAYDRAKYASLAGYAQDVVEIVDALGLERPVFVGHSVSAMIGVLASLVAPGRFGSLVLIGPSPRYLNDGDYVGGFEAAQIEELLAFLAQDLVGWSAVMAPVIMGRADRPELGRELEASFCRTDPEIALDFARVTFLSDNRADLARVGLPCLILQCADDVIAPPQVGAFVQAAIPGSRLVRLAAAGHCPHLSAPDEVIAAVRGFA